MKRLSSYGIFAFTPRGERIWNDTISQVLQPVYKNHYSVILAIP
jgi:hypothetical protein